MPGGLSHIEPARISHPENAVLSEGDSVLREPPLTEECNVC